MITKPPRALQANPLQKIVTEHTQHVDKYLEWYSPLDAHGRYLHFDQLRFRTDHQLDNSLVWSLVKLARRRQSQPVIGLGEPEQLASFVLTPLMQKAISEIDRNTTSAALEWMSSKINEEKHFEYLLRDLIEDEAISSSQLEGAATTTTAAKQLLKRQRKPRTLDERMIVGNFKMMKYAWEHRHRDLSLELILEIHAEGTEGIDDDTYAPGAFRQTDTVEVVDADGNTVHFPPPAANLRQRIQRIIKWVNTCHHNADSRDYLHPVVKAIVLHFIIGYEHPFRDGNGRVARALFYWYMFKNDYAAFRYIAISVLLKNAPAKYGKSYLYTESDELDLTYFIDYQCSVLLRAISAFKNAFKVAAEAEEKFSAWLWQSGLMRKLSDKQRIIFQVARSGIATALTANSVKNNLDCSYNTAATMLNGLVDLGIFKKHKDGREWVYQLLSPEKIKASYPVGK
jgi:Fic family protein